MAILSLPTIARLGDSYTENGIFSGRKSALSYGIYAEIELDGAVLVRPDHNFGVSSERIDQVLARIPDVITAGPDMCLIYAGVNDLLQNTALTALQMAQNIREIGRTLAVGGITPILSTIIRMDAFTSAMDAKRRAVNDFLLETDPYAVADPARLFDAIYGQTPQITGGSYDGTHPHAVGAQIIGSAFAGVISQINSVPADFGNDFSAITVTGSAGFVAAGITGTSATGWVLTGPPGTTVAATTISSDLTGGTDIRFNTDKFALTGLVGGDEVCFDIAMAYVGAPTITKVEAGVVFFDVSNVGTGSSSALSPRGVEGSPLAVQVLSGTVRIGPLVLPATTTQAQIVITISGIGVVDFTIDSVATRKTL